MVQYVTASELAGYLQEDVDTYTANQALTLASGMFSQAAGTWFASISVTYVTVGGRFRSVRLPFRPVTAVTAVRINGSAVTDFTVIKNVVYRQAGFGTSCLIPPDELEIDLTHGYASPTDDVKAAVMETAATAYAIPIAAVLGESIDDYQVRYSSAGGVQLSPAAQCLAEQYRGSLIA